MNSDKKPSEILFTCPNCNGPHFNVGVNGTLICVSVTEKTPKDELHGCGWRGHLNLTEAQRLERMAFGSVIIPKP